MKTYSVERIQELIDELAQFNKEDLANIVLTKDGMTLEISKELIDRWKFIGLSNKDFVDTEFWNDLKNHV